MVLMENRTEEDGILFVLAQNYIRTSTEKKDIECERFREENPVEPLNL